MFINPFSFGYIEKSYKVNFNIIILSEALSFK